MQFRKTLISCAMLVLCCLSFTSCAAMSAAQEADEERKECGCEAPPSTYFEANGFQYNELDLETIENMKLSVPTCDGLTEVGKISGGFFLSKELQDDACGVLTIARVLLKNKKDYCPTPTEAQIDKIIYAHPNPEYPNMVVARIDGEPAIFQWGGAAKDNWINIEAVVRDVHGVTEPEKIQAVRIAYISAPTAGFVEATITDRAELEAFYDAISELSGNGPTHIDYSDLTKAYPFYDCEIELVNGCSFWMKYCPQDNSVDCPGGACEGNEALPAWLERNAKR